MIYADTKLPPKIMPPKIIPRKSNRLVECERLRQLKFDGLDETIKLSPRKPNKPIKRYVLLDATLCNWDATIDIYYLIANDRIKKKCD
jgi:hypothetical protein